MTTLFITDRSFPEDVDESTTRKPLILPQIERTATGASTSMVYVCGWTTVPTGIVDANAEIADR